MIGLPAEFSVCSHENVLQNPLNQLPTALTSSGTSSLVTRGTAATSETVWTASATTSPVPMVSPSALRPTAATGPMRSLTVTLKVGRKQWLFLHTPLKSLRKQLTVMEIFVYQPLKSLLKQLTIEHRNEDATHLRNKWKAANDKRKRKGTLELPIFETTLKCNLFS